ncbi:MAG: DUF3750 domain-containing protein [Candidatus Woesearchaeota archaeon]
MIKNNILQLPEFEKDTYYVLFLESETSLPVRFITHTWIVTVYNGQTDRWDILHKKNLSKDSWQHLHKNFIPAFQGLPKYYFGNKKHWPAKIIGIVKGKKNSKAHKLCLQIQDAQKSYPFIDKYKFVPGPNCNSFTQWFLDKNNIKSFRISKTSLGREFWELQRFKENAHKKILNYWIKEQKETTSQKNKSVFGKQK